MLLPTDPIFIKYARYVLGWEGKGSADPTDTASQYVAPGQIHTIRGVIWPTFQSNAKKIGVEPTYANFLKMTSAQADKILYQFYLICKGDKMPDIIGLTITEFTWGSGLGNSKKAIRKAVRSFGFDEIESNGAINAAVLDAVNKIPVNELYTKLWTDRKAFLIGITERNPSQKKFIRGWLNRWANFQKLFPNTLVKKTAIGIGAILIGTGLFFLIRKYAKQS